VDFLGLLALIELFSLGVTSEYRFKIGEFAPRGGGGSLKIPGRGVALHQPFFLSENWGKWSFMRYKNAGTTFFRFVTNNAFDRQTDRHTEFSSLDRVCIPCITVEMCHYTFVHNFVKCWSIFHNYYCHIFHEICNKTHVIFFITF